MKDYLIIGGGIAGLYCAYKLSERVPGTAIAVIESDTELGGRIRTQMIPGFTVEKGAARFSGNHSRLLGSIREMGLDSYKTKLPTSRDFVYRGSIDAFDLKKALRDFYAKAQKVGRVERRKITLYQLAVKLYDDAYAQKLQASFGYDAEWTTLNADAGLRMFSRDFFQPSQEEDYYVLSCGLTTLVERIGETLRKRGVTFYLGTPVTDIRVGKVITVTAGSKEYQGKHLICALPKGALEKLSIFSQVPEIQDVTPIPLCRLYVKYPSKGGKPWFHQMEKTTTDHYLRYIIPINEAEGTMMYYTDSTYAKMWHNWSQVSEKQLIERVHQALREIFPKTRIEEPLAVKVCFWGAGVHLWKPGIDYQKSSRALIQPLGSQKVYICNEAYSQLQDWMEGSLQMAEGVLRAVSKPSDRKRKSKHRKKRV